MKGILVGISLCALAFPAVSETQFASGLYLESVTIEDEPATASRIGTSLISLGLSGEAAWSLDGASQIALGGGFGLTGGDDEDSDEVRVRNTTTGKVETKKESDSGLSLFADINYRYAFHESVRAVAGAGVVKYSLDRTVANCSDCPNEDIELDVGTYLKFGAIFGKNKGAEVQFRYFLADDFASALHATWRW